MCPLQRRPYDKRDATAAARNDGLRIRRPRAPVIRTQLQASGKRGPKRAPACSLNPNSRDDKHHK
jgi:hypothetical protein